MNPIEHDTLLRRVAALSPERRAMLHALLDEPQEVRPRAEPDGELSPAQRSLLAIWEQVLGVRGIGIHDDFFAVGGDSIAAMRVTAKAQKIGLPVSVREIVATPTIAALTAAMRDQAAGYRPDEACPLRLTPAQRRDAESGLLQHPSMLDGFGLRAARAAPRAVQAARAELVRRHDALRLRLRQSPSGWELIESGRAVEPPLVDLTALRPADAAIRLGHLERGLAVRPGEAEQPLCGSACWYDGREAGLLMVCHRWCADRQSMERLRAEAVFALDAYLAGEPALLPEPGRFSAWAREQIREAAAQPDRQAGGGRLYRLAGVIAREVVLPGGWSRREADGPFAALERASLVALARSFRPDGRALRVRLDASPRTDTELRDAVGYYVRPIDLCVEGAPVSVRVLRPEDADAAPDLGISCVFQRPLESTIRPRRPRRVAVWTRAEGSVWSRCPVEIRNAVEPGRWRTVWRFDAATHSAARLEERCDRFLAELVRLASAPADCDALGAAFAEADLSPEELDGLLAG